MDFSESMPFTSDQGYLRRTSAALGKQAKQNENPSERSTEWGEVPRVSVPPVEWWALRYYWLRSQPANWDMAKVQRASSNERACPKDDINTGEKTNSEQRSCRCQDYRLDPAILYSTPWHLCVRKMWKESTNKDVTSKYKNKSVLGLTDDEATVPHFKATTYYLLSGPPGINTVSDYFSR